MSVYAGAVGEFFTNIFRGAEASSVSSSKNISNMQLLAAASAPSGPTHDTLVDNNALVPEVGPLGGAPEIENHKPTSDQISIYVVREGDTLSQIAEMFNVTANTIKWGNDLSSNTLKTGQTLVILPISGVKHTVSKGDSVASLAKKYNADAGEILAYNSLKQGESLEVGSVLIIPDGEVSQTSPTPTRSSGGTKLKEYGSYYIRPVAGGVRTQGIHGYNAVDLASAPGTEIYASADGEVIVSRSGGWNGGYGNYVVIKHSNGTQTLYAHNSKNVVSAGEVVRQGQLIGYMGSTGKATGTHLHFEIRGAKNPF